MDSLNDRTTATLMQLHADLLFTYDARGRMLQAIARMDAACRKQPHGVSPAS
jgi:hypothetical protein